MKSRRRIGFPKTHDRVSMSSQRKRSNQKFAPSEMGSMVCLRLTAFVQGLQQLDWTVGRNLRIDYRWSAGEAERSTSSLAACRSNASLSSRFAG
jgi:hypothetical protein